MIPFIGKFSWFQLFKYIIYSFLTINAFLFLHEEWNSLTYRFATPLRLSEIIAAFAASIDTISWVVLLLFFELETFVLSGKQLKGSLKWVLRIVRGVCYVFIVYAFVGYFQKYLWVVDFSLISDTPCSFIGKSWMLEVDDFEVITKENCQTLSSSELLKKSDATILTNIKQWKEACNLALVDVFNSAAWILVAVVLEVDVWLELKSRFTGKIYIFSKVIKIVLYLILLAAAIIWAYYGSSLDFWDAFLWIIAFIFIENNLEHV